MKGETIGIDEFLHDPNGAVGPFSPDSQGSSSKSLKKGISISSTDSEGSKSQQKKLGPAYGDIGVVEAMPHKRGDENITGEATANACNEKNLKKASDKDTWDR
jgi:hypothetical protein